MKGRIIIDQQNKTKPEANQNKPAELSDKDLEQVAGGIIIDGGKLAREEGPEERLLVTTKVNVDGTEVQHNETLVRDTSKVIGVKVKAGARKY